jgi:hypothetical protein
MSATIISFPRPRPRITSELLSQLTTRVINERPDINVITDYGMYCAMLGISPSGFAHYDWAMERLGLTEHKALA